MNDTYVSRDGEQYGPYSIEDISQYVTEGRFASTDHAWKEGMSEWVALHTMLPNTPPPPTTYAPPPPPARQSIRPPGIDHQPKKSTIISDDDFSDRKILPAFLLWFFLGPIGAHHFYAGSVLRGVGYLVCLVAVFALPMFSSSLPDQAAIILGPLPAVLLGVGLLADLIRLVTGNFKDGNGLKMVDWT